MPPIHMSYDVAGATVAQGHYNTIGRAVGELRCGGRTVEINADGFCDHSWGVRRSHLPGSRWLVAVFDPTFFIMAIPILTDQGRHMVGYVMDGGVLGALAESSSHDGRGRGESSRLRAPLRSFDVGHRVDVVHRR